MKKAITMLIFILILMGLSACDGGSKSYTQFAPIIKAIAVYQPGTFKPSAQFQDMCENPRSGIDPYTGQGYPDIQGTVVDENNWLRSWSNELYLWYNEIDDVDPSTVNTPSEYFDLMQTFATTPSGAPKDKFHFLMPTDEWRLHSQSGISAGYGAEFAIIKGSPPRTVVVAYTQPGSPATSAGVSLARGDTILKVDGADLVNGNTQAIVDTLNAGLFPSTVGETHSFQVQRLSGLIETVTMTSAEITLVPVQNVGAISTASGQVGYMLFNEYIATSEQQLIDAVNTLKGSGITDLVLDLRYNGGGYLDIANELAFMLAGPAAASGQIFDEMQFNDKHTTHNPVTGQVLAPSYFRETAYGFSATAGSSLPSLDLSRVFVLTGPGTCSASEAVINGLRGINVEVIQIGSTTCGKPYGFYPYDNCGTTYFSIQFKGVNAKGFGDYSDGFSPANALAIKGEPVTGCAVADDYTHQLGDPLEARLSAALQYRIDGTCPTPSGTGFSDVAAGQTFSQPLLSASDGWIPKPVWLQNRITGP